MHLFQKAVLYILCSKKKKTMKVKADTTTTMTRGLVRRVKHDKTTLIGNAEV